MIARTRIIHEVKMLRISSPAAWGGQMNWDVPSHTFFKESYTTEERAQELLEKARNIYNDPANAWRFGGEPQIIIEWETIEEREE